MCYVLLWAVLGGLDWHDMEHAWVMSGMHNTFSQKTRRACRSGWSNTVIDTEVIGVCGNEMDSSGSG